MYCKKWHGGFSVANHQAVSKKNQKSESKELWETLIESRREAWIVDVTATSHLWINRNLVLKNIVTMALGDAFLVFMHITFFFFLHNSST